MHRVSRTWRVAALAVASVLWALPSAGHEVKVGSLTIGHPHVFEPDEPLPKALPLYMTIRNDGGQEDHLIGAESPFAASATLSIPADTGSKVPGGGIALPAASEVTLRKTTPHIVFHDLKEPLEGYQYVPATLIFERAGKVEIEIYVEEHQ